MNDVSPLWEIYIDHVIRWNIIGIWQWKELELNRTKRKEQKMWISLKQKLYLVRLNSSAYICWTYPGKSWDSGLTSLPKERKNREFQGKNKSTEDDWNWQQKNLEYTETILKQYRRRAKKVWFNKSTDVKKSCKG